MRRWDAFAFAFAFAFVLFCFVFALFSHLRLPARIFGDCRRVFRISRVEDAGLRSRLVSKVKVSGVDFELLYRSRAKGVAGCDVDAEAPCLQPVRHLHTYTHERERERDVVCERE